MFERYVRDDHIQTLLVFITDRKSTARGEQCCSHLLMYYLRSFKEVRTEHCYVMEADSTLNEYGYKFNVQKNPKNHCVRNIDKITEVVV